MVKIKAEDVPKKDEEETKSVEQIPKEEEEETKSVEDVEEDETDEEKKKKKGKKAVKGEAGGESPAEDTASATDANSTMTPGAVINTNQNVFVPQTGIVSARNATGSTPAETSYSGKSASFDLQKSPLFVELSKQMAGLEKAMKLKVEALEKSMADRIANTQKSLAKIEKFYSQPFYKAIDENVQPEATLRKSISEQINSGSVRFRD